METPGSSFTPTPLGHEENVEVGQPSRANALQWRQTRFNFPNPEVRGAAGLAVLPEMYLSGSENIEDFKEGIENLIKFLEIPCDLTCAYLKVISLREETIGIKYAYLSAEYSH
ncbi:uncharacterized protein TNCV_2487411 [Trichonephila clavipes]|uniref:Uncharacterized protein n=1 Tax=Trichonephila clavipes TaxID=2585209 RepID=A0A8X7BB36_TRICX|nr:uncharacterized protein TNCV_2487411 [Trichonephila clavipes]